MDRLCGRPGCSERASVAYGMRAEDLVFWLDRLPTAPDAIGGVLCRRHADSMVVPRGWTLDDLRDPELHLFRPPTPPEHAAPRRARTTRPRRSRADVVVGEQLELGGEPSEPAEDVPPPEASAAGDAREPDVWTPAFDEADDLGGLLSAQGPLLSRAFKTAERPDG